MPWFDANDTLGAFSAMMPKDSSNLPTGVSTYGPWEYLSYCDDLFFNAWMDASQMGGMGLCYGLILTTAATRLAFVPIGLYS
jgi:hypothetical protein